MAAFFAAGAAFFYHQETFRWALFKAARYGLHVLLFAALAWAGYAVGRLVPGRLLGIRGAFWEIDLAAGFIAFGGGAFILAAAKTLYPWVIRGVVISIIVVSAPKLWRFAKSAPPHVAAGWKDLSPGVRAVMAAMAPFAFSYAACAGQPPFQWDVPAYHLFLPKLFLQEHSFVYLPRLINSSMPLGAEMIFTWAFGWDGPGAASAVAPLLNALMVVATWRLARCYLDDFWAALAAALLLLTPSFASVVNVAYVDFILGAFVTMALVLYIRRANGGAAAAGFFLGAALSVKYTGIYALGPIIFIFALDLAKKRIRWRYAFTFLGVAFIVVAPWLAKAYLERGNPVFPVCYEFFGGKDMSVDVARGMVRAAREVGMGRGIRDYLLLWYRVATQGGSGYAHLAGCLWPVTFVAVPLAPVFFRKWRLLVFIAACFAAWAFIGYQQLRHLSPAFGVTAVLIAGVCAAAADSFQGRGCALARGFVAVTFVAAGYFLSASQLRDNCERFFDYWDLGADGFLIKRVYSYGAARFINGNLPADAVVLLVFDNSQYFLERQLICESLCDASETIYAVQRSATTAAVARYINSLGVTHILMNNAAASYFWRYYEPATRTLWLTYLEKYTAPIYQDPWAEVREVKNIP